MFTHRFFHVALAIAALAITSLIAWQVLAAARVTAGRDLTFRTPQTSDCRP